MSETLQLAAGALRSAEELRKALRETEGRLRVLCRAYAREAGLYGTAPHHLAQACRARGLL